VPLVLRQYDKLFSECRKRGYIAEPWINVWSWAIPVFIRRARFGGTNPNITAIYIHQFFPRKIFSPVEAVSKSVASLNASVAKIFTEGNG